MTSLRRFDLDVRAETLLDLGDARTAHRIDASPWLGHPAPAFWCEWDHEHEGSRSLRELVEGVIGLNWHRLIPPGSTCIDIGAHSGDTSIPMGLIAYDRARERRGAVYAVEPNPALAQILSLNLALNSHIADFVFAPFAITDVDMDVVELADHGNANCNGGVLEGEYSTALKEQLSTIAKFRYTAPGVSLYSLVEKMTPSEAQDIRFVKIDCEGYDKQILRGARSILEQIQPTLFVEWFAWFTPADDDDLFAAIAEIGYRALDPLSFEPVDRAGRRLSDLVCIPLDAPVPA